MAVKLIECQRSDQFAVFDAEYIFKVTEDLITTKILPSSLSDTVADRVITSGNVLGFMLLVVGVVLLARQQLFFSPEPFPMSESRKLLFEVFRQRDTIVVLHASNLDASLHKRATLNGILSVAISTSIDAPHAVGTTRQRPRFAISIDDFSNDRYS